MNGRSHHDGGQEPRPRLSDALDVVLAALHSSAPASFPSASRLNYRIVNSVDVIMRKLRPLPTKRQIKQGANVAHLGTLLSSEDRRRPAPPTSDAIR